MSDEVRRRRQGIFREVNACIADAPGRRDGETEFLCECGEASCTGTFSATSDEIEAVHGRPSYLIVAARHAPVPGWRVVDANDRYAVLERERVPLPHLSFAPVRPFGSRSRI